MGKIASIVYRPAEAPAHPETYFSRVALEQATLVEDYGIEGDCKGGHGNRQLNIMSRETVDTLTVDGFKTRPGELGEQIVVSGLDADLNALPEGARLQIGAQAVVELIKPRTGCDRFEAIQGLSPQLAAGRLGMIARVIQGGAIRVGDEVQRL